ncbi:hypothetical protein L1275_003175 [Flavobacterium sp. HSC-61S13]|nr:hypothetical protein [Flavobacterium sp. HSC-61S13]
MIKIELDIKSYLVPSNFSQIFTLFFAFYSFDQLLYSSIIFTNYNTKDQLLISD